MPENPEILQEFAHALVERAKFQGETKFDAVTRTLYSTDASIYQIEPLGVLFPRSAEEIAMAVSLAGQFHLPILARGSGSSLAGQAIGNALILDCSRYLNRCLEINAEQGWAEVEPGVILASLNRLAAVQGLQFGPDPASAERATLGGCIANNATGAHSILYGMTVDHLLETQVVLPDGRTANFAPLPVARAQQIAENSDTAEARLYKAALVVRSRYAEAVRQDWPQTWRRVSGYNLNYLLPWSPTRPPLWEQAAAVWGASPAYPPESANTFNLANLLAGSEGTLGVLQKARLRLVALPKATLLAVIAYDSIAAACDDVPYLLSHGPSAVELIPRKMVELARTVPAYASQLNYVDQLSRQGQAPEALLVVEFSGPEKARLRAQAAGLARNTYLAEAVEAQKQVWAVRKVGLGILMSRPGSQKPVAFIEDLGVPVDKLGDFVREIERILAGYDTQAEIYAHASAGCLHIRPLIDLKTGQGRRYLRQIAQAAVELTLSLGGSISSEHGDGLARSEWLERAYGAELVSAFRLVKEAADPEYLFNPGKIIDPPAMDTNLRYGEAYASAAWTPALDFYRRGAGGLVDAIEQCNGAGVCRKADGVMCPSFQASQDEMHSTRGRANLLRAMISGQFPDGLAAEKAVKEALDLCLACKGCKAECPSGVDMAKLKYEFTQHYYQADSHRRPLRDYLFGYIDRFARLGAPFAALANWGEQNELVKNVLEKTLGLSRRRSLPRFAGKTLEAEWKAWRRRAARPSTAYREKALFLADAFGAYFHPQASLAALQLLERAEVEVIWLPGLGAGRTLISKGFLNAARRRARQVVEAAQRLDPQGRLPVVGVEPSEIYTLRDEYLDLLPGDPYVERLAGRAWTIEEYLLRCPPGEPDRLQRVIPAPAADLEPVLLHGHCYQKSQPPASDGLPVGAAASAALLRAAGYPVQVVDSGCCGMAGAFGYEAEHFHFSRQVAGLKLLPAVKAAVESTPGVQVAAAGVSCQAQIMDLSGVPAKHPVEFLKRYI